LFEFTPAVRMDEAAATFELALLATESLHGDDRVTLEAVYKVDADARTVEVDRTSVVGSTLALIYLGYARREFGTDAFRMRRVHAAMTMNGEGER
jgi:hypothetical protein